MSRPNTSRADRFAEMNRQEEMIAKKRALILEKQIATKLGEKVKELQKNNVSSESTEVFTPSVNNSPATNLNVESKKPQNTFCNDGSFLQNFQKILEQSKKDDEKFEINISLQKQKELDKIIDTGNFGHSEEPIISPTITMQQMMPEQQLGNPQPPQLPPPPPQPPQFLISQAQTIPSSIGYAQFTTAVPTMQPVILNTTFFGLPPPPPMPTLISQPLYMIPQPPQDPTMQMTSIQPQPPKEVEMVNLESIQIPPIMDQELPLPPQPYPHQEQAVFSDNKQFDSLQLPTTLQTLVDLVVEHGDQFEEYLSNKPKCEIHPSLWFLFDKKSEKYSSYRGGIEVRKELKYQPMFSRSEDNNKYDPESVMQKSDNGEDSDEEYMKDRLIRNSNNIKRRIECRNELSDEEREERRAEEELKKKKKKSRWGEKSEELVCSSPPPPPINVVVQTSFANQNKPMLSGITRTDPALLAYARQNYGSTQLTEEDWKKCEEHFKVNLLYQDMMSKREEIDRLAKGGQFKYEYDSDEDVEGGTWEHKLRKAEMDATDLWANALTKQSEGKHHIGDFLPPEELKKFMEQYEGTKSNRQPDLSDYKEFKLKEDNIGFKMLQKLGWKEGQGLGSEGSGILDPVNNLQTNQ
ncbi:SUGP1 family protein [Megaselia abdita]